MKDYSSIYQNILCNGTKPVVTEEKPAEVKQEKKTRKKKEK